MEYKIYSLIDPRTGEAFYVGTTSQSLKSRLDSHLSYKQIRTEKSVITRRVRFIEEIIIAGLMPLINQEAVVKKSEINKKEEEVYRSYVEKGAILLQNPKYFHYFSKKKKSDWYHFHLNLDGWMEKALKEIATRNGRTINEEINIAVKLYIEYNKKTDEGEGFKRKIWACG